VGPEPTVEFETILDRARSGDERAWEHLYDSLAPQLLGYLRVRGAADPEALVGDVFLSLARGLDDFTGTQSGFRSWVFVIATSRLYDERRRRQRRPSEPLEPVVEAGLCSPDDVQAEVERVAATAAARDLLALLTPDQRRVVALRVFGGLTSAEVAATVDKPVGAVKALYRRGLAAMRRDLVEPSAGVQRTRELLADSRPVPVRPLSAVTDK
jgi:RNA polymerase sigma factor (sigma-70 family)